MTIGWFETIKIIGQALAKNLTKLLEQYGLNFFYYICERWGVKFECNDNCFEMNYAMWSFKFGWKFQKHFFGHVFFKACHHVTIDEKICKNHIFISIKFAQLDLYKCITWPKKSINGIEEWKSHV
jgi:hypothetical protein